ncbi:endonuclease/exonuclease/phosphatase family protein [Cochleicola gelatinilyticus]|uniref:Endonuclease n=1 Tax=Cochleicola gelatinilyticus TaxID=1763537 RepID=A0A167GZF0_9FLAO|nr:endonuclease/exonuclease/phosphatase family protein [Cochleicola gelatinilyticus]OAB78055.1 endonuclease [Cochleicola gelatinilyticus]
MNLKNFLQIFGAIAIVLTLVPLIAIDYWWIRMFDFPHIQLTVLTFTAMITYFMRFDIKSWQDHFFAFAIIGCFIFQFVKIYPYTPFAPYVVLNSTPEKSERDISIYTANVFQENKEKDAVIADIITRDPDVLLFLETNKDWQNHIEKHVLKSYPYTILEPLPNTYGMLLYSKKKLIDPKIKYLVDDSIPSFHTKLLLTPTDTVQVYTIHPTPPMPQHNPSSSDRDAEMMKIANMSRASKLPVLVIGDFNDVAWSATTSLFENVGELLDVRKGRGFYNTFNANSFLLRWPLDHIFVSSEFRVIQVTLGKDIHSDHFPTFTHLSFEPELAYLQKPQPPSEAELQRAKEQASGVRKLELDF